MKAPFKPPAVPPRAKKPGKDPTDSNKRHAHTGPGQERAMIPRTSHVHILDTGQGDWGGYANHATARRTVKKLLEEINSFFEFPMTKDELTIIDAREWCADDPEPCEYDREKEHLAAMGRPPLWQHDFPSPPRGIYRIDGKRVARWKMTCPLSIDRATELWPFCGHPVSIPVWHFNIVMTDSRLCPCSTHSHRRKGCIIGPSGLKCAICGALHQDYGNISRYCLPCQDWMEHREAYLADWAAGHRENADMAAQLALL